MKKLLTRLAAFGLVAGLAATSYTLPAAAAVSDTHTQFAGATDDGIIIIIIGDDYFVVWVDGSTAENAVSGPLATAASDKIFDAQ